MARCSWLLACGAWSTAAVLWGQDERLERALTRLGEEAEMFRLAAPTVLSEEKLEQRALQKPRRFRPRIGAAATEPPELRYKTREIVSEYSFASFQDSPNVLHEFRQVTSVDGKPVNTREKARQKLAMGMKSADDRLKRRMHQEFERHGLTNTATNSGQLIMLFEKRRQGDYAFHFAGRTRIGSEEAIGYTFRQARGEGLTIFEGREVVRKPLEGEVWVREEDSLPLRIRLNSVRERGKLVFREEVSVDYVLTAHGFLAPAAVVHRQYAADQMMVENTFQYVPFRKFGAETEIRFTDVPLEPPKAP
jgi:hypothetical protein